MQFSLHLICIENIAKYHKIHYFLVVSDWVGETAEIKEEVARGLVVRQSSNLEPPNHGHCMVQLDCLSVSWNLIGMAS